ncbi:hypothetical protein D3C77_770100 [compost metagenome]
MSVLDLQACADPIGIAHGGVGKDDQALAHQAFTQAFEIGEGRRANAQGPALARLVVEPVNLGDGTAAAFP